MESRGITQAYFQSKDWIQPTEVVWHVAFIDYRTILPVSGKKSGIPWYIRWFTKKVKYNHCCAFTYEAAMDSWVVIDPLIWQTKVDIIPQDFLRTSGFSGLDDFLHEEVGAKVVAWMNKPNIRTVPTLLPHSCVSVVKSLFGIRSWRIISPYQLYRYLIKEGGLEFSTDTKITG